MVVAPVTVNRSLLRARAKAASCRLGNLTVDGASLDEDLQVRGASARKSPKESGSHLSGWGERWDGMWW